MLVSARVRLSRGAKSKRMRQMGDKAVRSYFSHEIDARVQFSVLEQTTCGNWISQGTHPMEDRWRRDDWIVREDSHLLVKEQGATVFFLFFLFLFDPNGPTWS